MKTKRKLMNNIKLIKGTTVTLRDGEDINRALRRFKNKVEDAGTLKVLQSKEFYEKPTTKRKRKAAAGRARHLKKLEKEQLPKKNY